MYVGLMKQAEETEPKRPRVGSLFLIVAEGGYVIIVEVNKLVVSIPSVEEEEEVCINCTTPPDHHLDFGLPRNGPPVARSNKNILHLKMAPNLRTA